MIRRRSVLKSALFGAAGVFALNAGMLSASANETLKIGFVGVTSGPSAAWGTSNVRSMKTLADM